MVIGNIFLWAVPQSFPIWAKFVWFYFYAIDENLFTLFSTPNNALSLKYLTIMMKDLAYKYLKEFYNIRIIATNGIDGFIPKPTAEISDGRLNPQSYVNFSYFTSAAAIVLCTYMFIITFSHVPRLRELAKRKRTRRRI